MNAPNNIRRKVLVIDDNEGILFAMQKALQLKEYDVYVADTFIGIDVVEKIAPDLIYLDISLAGADGRGVAKELKGDERTKHIPIIILTAYPNAAELTKEAGADAFLSKPFELQRLWEITQEYASGSERETAL